MPSQNPHRLDRSVVPNAYRVHIATDLEGALFEGTVSIDAVASEATTTIVCHAVDLSIASVVVHSDEATIGATASLDPETERLTLELDDQIAAGPVRIEIAFHGTLNDRLVGYYRSAFNTDLGPATMGVTQFEAPYARRAFPCWDEPEFKATFTVSLTCDEGLTAVSNTRELNRTLLADGRTRFDFAQTMIMSTYLVAWVVGELEISETVDAGTTQVRVIHRPGQGHLTSFALECAAHAVAWFEDYYGIDYPGDKLDLIAVPDFAFGAMENLGCVTFRENLLLIDPERSNRSEQERAATVIEHEIAHMWFGDLVTMQWWEGIWLNEAFATFMEFCCADSFRPDWDIWTSFGLSKSQAFETDALGNTRPIEYEVTTPAQAEGMFDILTYEKGASVLRMFERWVGKAAFRDGVRQYLGRHAYGNTDAADLWDALSESSGVDVKAMMNTWILQGGHPLITVERSESGLRLSQRPFGFEGGDDAPDTHWIVPVRLSGTIGGEPFERQVLLDQPELGIDLDGPVDWVTANSGFTGFYRTEYAPDLQAGLQASIAGLSAVDRYAFIDDSWALFLANRRTLEELMDSLSSLTATETEPSVWRRVVGIVAALRSIAPSTAVDFAAFVEHLIGDRLAPAADTTRAPATPAELDLHAVLFRFAGTIGESTDVVAQAHELFAGLPDSTAGNPELAAAVLDVVGAHASTADFDRLLDIFHTAATAQEELRALSALSQAPDLELVRRFCDLCATEVRTQNAPYALAQAMSSPVGGPLVWRFVAENWESLLERFPSSSIVRMAGGIRSFSTPDLVEEIHAFFADNDLPQSRLTLAQHLERLRVNGAVRQRLALIGDQRAQ